MLKLVGWGMMMVAIYGLASIANAGVIIEGKSVGIAEVAKIKYQPEDHTLVLNDGKTFALPVSRSELLEIVKALRYDDRIGVAAKANNEMTVYGKLPENGEIAVKLHAADELLRAIVYADSARLKNVALPENYQPQKVARTKDAKPSAIYFALDNFIYNEQRGAYRPENFKAELMLIPLVKNADNETLTPDYDALERGDLLVEERANVEHIRKRQAAYLALPTLAAAVKIGEAAALVRHLRAGGVDLATLEKNLERGQAFAQNGNGGAASYAAQNAAKKAVEQLNEQNLYAENIKQILAMDNQYANADQSIKMNRHSVNDGSYVEFRRQYLNNIKAVDLAKTPDEFRRAFLEYAAAWEKTLAWLATQKIADTPDDFNLFKSAHAPYRQELSVALRKCKDIAAKYGNE